LNDLFLLLITIVSNEDICPFPRAGASRSLHYYKTTKTNKMRSNLLLALCTGASLLLGTSAQAQWTELGTGNDTIAAGSYDINTITTDPAGNVYAAGQYIDGGGNQYVSKWNGTTWSELGTGTFSLGANGDIYSICSDPSGNIYAAGAFTGATTGQGYVAKWNGTSWTEVGAGQKMGGYFIQHITMLISDAAGNIYAGGQLADSTFSYIVSKWDGTNWSRLGAGFNGSTDVIALDANGTLYTTGQFTNGANAGSGHNYVAKWDGTSWSEVGAGSGALNMNSYALALCTDPSHNVYVGGRFTDAGGSQYVAKYDGIGWSELGGGITNTSNNDIDQILSDASGNIYAAGDFATLTTNSQFVAKWNGTSWSDYGALDCNNAILAMALHGNTLYAAGAFTTDPNQQFGHYVAKYDGTGSGNHAGLSELDRNTYRMYPNPTASSFALQFTTPITATITVTDIAGQEMATWSMSNETQKNFAINSFASGLYMVKITTQSGDTRTTKLIKD
jgi:hypothetical protein